VLDSVSVDVTVSLGEGVGDAVRVTEPVSLCVCKCDGVALVVADGVALTDVVGDCVPLALCDGEDDCVTVCDGVT